MAEITRMYYTPEAMCKLSNDEVKFIASIAHIHYDFHCRQSAEYGGFIFGWLAKTEIAPYLEICVPFGYADTVCKILEMTNEPKGKELKQFFFRIMTDINSAVLKVNGE